MNNTFDFNSKKYMILLVLICLVFAIFIIKAFDYLPDTEMVDSNDTEIENINTPSKINRAASEENAEVVKKKPIQKSGVLYKSQDSYSNDETTIEEIDAPSGIGEEIIPNKNISETAQEQISPDVLALKSIINARNLASSGNLSSSLEEYKNALNNAQDKEIKAEALEGIALLYASNKKYEAALSFATKALNTSPSSSREVLIAKIYYSAGRTETAITKLNEMLKRGFKY